MELKVFVAGNPLLARDALPLALLPALRRRLPEMDFEELDVEGLEDAGGELVIIDTVEGIERPAVISDVDAIGTRKVYSLHDFDLGMRLKLLKKMGMIRSVTIFGVPPGYPRRRALDELTELIRATLPSGNERRRTCRGRRRG